MKSISSSIKNLIIKPSIHQGTGVIFDQGLYSLTNFLTGVLLARHLRQEDYGIYVLSLSLIILIMVTQRAIISVPYTVKSQKFEQNDLETYTGSVFVHQLLLLFGTIIFCFLISNFYLLRVDSPHNSHNIFIPYAAAAIGVLLRDFVRSFLLARQKIWQSVFMGVGINIIQLSALLLLFINNALTIINSFLIIGFCSLLPSLIIFFMSSNIKIKKNRVLRDFSRNFQLGKWIFGTNTISATTSQVYPWLLALLVDKRAVAVLGVSIALANFLGPLMQGTYSFILPKMVKSKEDGNLIRVVNIMKKAVILLSVILGLWLACGILFGEYLLELIYSSKYIGYNSVLTILILNSLIAGISVPLNAALEALERADVSFKSQIGGLVITILLGAFLVNKFGIYGAAAGMLLSSLIICFVRWRGLLILIKRFKSDSKPKYFSS